MNSALSPRLRAVIASFAERPDARTCLDPDRAFGACEPISLRFAAALRDATFEPEVVELANLDGDGSWHQRHVVVKIEDHIVDWSYRQFAWPYVTIGSPLSAPDIPVPLISSVEDMWAPCGDDAMTWEVGRILFASTAPLPPRAHDTGVDWRRRGDRSS